MKKLALILPLLPALALATPLDDAAVLARVAAAPSIEEAEGLDALTLFTGTYIQVTDGKAIFHRQELVTLYTEYAIEHLGDPRLAWDARRQELDIHAHRSYLPGGGVLDAPENACNEVTPRGLDRDVEFLDLREIVLTRVGLERGVTVFLDYTIRDLEPGWLPYSYLEWPLGEWPARERVVEVGPGLKAEVFHPEGYTGKVGGFIEKGDGLSWQRRDLPARPRDLPDRQGDFVPWIVVSAADDWSSLGVGIQSAMSLKADGLAEQMDAWLEGRPLLSDRQKVEACLDFVGERTVLVRHGLLPWARAPRDAAAILGSQAATSLERQTLLLACLREMDVSARLFWPASWHSLKDGPALASGLDDPGLSIEGTGIIVNCASLDTHHRPQQQLQGNLLTGTANWGSGFSKLDGTDTIRQRLHWDLEQGKAWVWGELSGPSFADAGWSRPERELESWASGWGEEISELRLLERDRDSIEFELEVEAPAPGPGEDGYATLALPLPPLSPTRLLPGPPYTLHRDAPTAFEGNLKVELDWEIILPEGMEAWSPEHHQAILGENEWSSYAELEGHQLRARWIFNALERQPVSMEDWPVLREALLEARDPRNREILLKSAD